LKLSKVKSPNRTDRQTDTTNNVITAFIEHNRIAMASENLLHRHKINHNVKIRPCVGGGGAVAL